MLGRDAACRVSAGYHAPSQYPARFVKFKTRVSGIELAAIAVAEIAEEVDLPFAVGKILSVHFAASKPDIGPQSSPTDRAASMK
jgi:hypothetical protein